MTDEEIVAIRDAHLPSQGERFDCIAFAREILKHSKSAIASHLIDVWVAEKGKIQWAKAVEIVAICTDMPEDKKAELLSPDGPLPNAELSGRASDSSRRSG